MALKKKIFGSLFMLLMFAIAAGGYFSWRILKEKEISPTIIFDLPDIDLSLSGLGKMEFPELSISFDMDFGGLDLDVASTSPSLENLAQIAAPSINLDVSSIQGAWDFSQTVGGEEKSSSGASVSESVCRPFKAAPSCSFVPSQHRSLCEKCKEAGF